MDLRLWFLRTQGFVMAYFEVIRRVVNFLGDLGVPAFIMQFEPQIWGLILWLHHH